MKHAQAQEAKLELSLLLVLQNSSLVHVTLTEAGTGV